MNFTQKKLSIRAWNDIHSCSLIYKKLLTKMRWLTQILVALQWSFLSLGGKVKEEHISQLISGGLLVSIPILIFNLTNECTQAWLFIPLMKKALAFS